MTYRMEAVLGTRSPDFDEAYAALAAEFAPRGELERREVVAEWLDGAAARPATWPAYQMLVARDERGALAGVRDCHVAIDRAAGLAVAYLAHALVLPAYRRTGLGALLRNAPITLVTDMLRAMSIAPGSMDVLLAAEMEHPSTGDEASVVRLVAYGKEGFSAIAPAALPYWQPDFRDLGARDVGEARPIPLLAIVRHVGHEAAATLPKALARAFVETLYAVFSTHVRADHLAALEARTLGVLDVYPGDEVPLLPLPRSPGDPALLSLFPRSSDDHTG